MAYRSHIIFFIILFMFIFTGVAGPQENNGPYVIGNGVTSPIVQANPRPSFTEEAQSAHISGVVVLQCIVRKDGTVDSFKVIRGLGYGLDESVINTIATKWKFKPGTKNGVPVDVMINIEVVFSLGGSRSSYDGTGWVAPQPAAADETVIFANFGPTQAPSLSDGIELRGKMSIGILIEMKRTSTLKRIEIVVQKNSGENQLKGLLVHDNNGPDVIVETCSFEVPPAAALKPATVVSVSLQHPMLKANERYWFILAPDEPGSRYFWYRHNEQSLTSIIFPANSPGPPQIRNNAPGFMLRLIGDALPND